MFCGLLVLESEDCGGWVLKSVYKYLKGCLRAESYKECNLIVGGLPGYLRCSTILLLVPVSTGAAPV